MDSQKSFVTWFRDSSPYIHAHRNKTIVISFVGEAVLADDFDHHVHDYGLLSRCRSGYDCMDAGGRATQKQLPSNSLTQHLPPRLVGLRYR
jgi:hypothetical protein